MNHKVYICCPKCGGNDLRKRGKRADGAQRFWCKICGKIWQNKYKYNARKVEFSDDDLNVLSRKMGVRAAAEFLKISKDTVGNRLKKTHSKCQSFLQEN